METPQEPEVAGHIFARGTPFVSFLGWEFPFGIEHWNSSFSFTRNAFYYIINFSRWFRVALRVQFLHTPILGYANEVSFNSLRVQFLHTPILGYANEVSFNFGWVLRAKLHFAKDPRSRLIGSRPAGQFFCESSNVYT